MAWASVEIVVPDGLVKNVINLDTVCRIGQKDVGSYIHFVDGTSIDVTDHIEDLIEVLRKTKE